MNKETKIQLTIETPAIGDVVMEVPYTETAYIDNNEIKVDELILNIPNRMFYGVDFTRLDLSLVVEHDIEMFKKLNEISDENHQVYIDTLCVYGVKISGNYIRIQYWFHQDGDKDSHRMCAGVLTHCVSRGNYLHHRDEVTKVFPECYSSDVCVYW